MITEEKMLNYLQSQLDDFNEDKARYGVGNHIVSKKFDVMIACKEMTEALIVKPVNLGLDGKVTVTENLVNVIAKDAEAYHDIFFKVDDTIIHVAEGSGDNLDNEDIKAGYIDYIYYEVYDLAGNEKDGGMIMLTDYFVDLYSATSDAISDVLEDIYDSVDKYTELMENGGIKYYTVDDINELPEGVLEKKVVKEA